MLWLSYPVLSLVSDSAPGGIDPTSAVWSYAVRDGPGAVVALLLGWLLVRGWRLVSPERAETMRAEARADLLAELERITAERAGERDRLIGEKRGAERQRDEAMKVARDLTPLLSSFVATSGALIPILQGIIAARPAQRRGGAGQ